MKNIPPNLDSLWNLVPVDYYQNGIEKNILQKIWHKGKLKNILNQIDNQPSQILDIGCASGWFLSQIAVNYPLAECTGIDVYKDAIDYGKKCYKSLKLILSDAHSLPFPDNSFDVVICSEVLEHVSYPEKVMKEIKRVLKKEGTAIIEMDSGHFIFRIIWYLWTRSKGNVWKDAHLQSYNTKKLEKLIKDNGFLIDRKKSFNYSMAVVFRAKL